MPYITSIERMAQKKAFLVGLKNSLELKFGAEGLSLFPEIQAIDDLGLLESLFEAIKNAPSPEDLRRLWSPPSSAEA